MLSVAGPMTIETAAGLKAEAASIFGQGPDRVDLAEVTEADSAGLALLLEWLRRSRSVDRVISVSPLPPALSSLAALYGLAELFPQ